MYMYLVAWHAVLCGAQQLVADRWRRDRREAGFGAETVARRLHSRLYHLHWPREECGIISCLQLGSFDAVLGYATGPQEVGVLETCNGAPGQKIIWRPLFSPGYIHTNVYDHLTDTHGLREALLRFSKWIWWLLVLKDAVIPSRKGLGVVIHRRRAHLSKL